MSNKVLIKISPPIWPIFDVEIEIIKKELEKKSKVTIITCDGEKKFCVANEKMSKIKCSFCKQRLSKGIKILKNFHKNIDLINEKIDYRNNKIFQNDLKKINSLNKLNKLKYNNIDIGTSVTSTIVTQFKTQNINVKKHLYLIEELLIQSISSYIFFKNLIKKKKYSKFLVFNGRIYNYRPLLRYGQKNKLNLYCYDYHYFSHDRYLVKKLNFTQNIELRAKELYQTSIIRRRKIRKQLIYNKSKKFFKTKLSKKGIGPPHGVWHIVQTKNLLPENFDHNKFTISFFTSNDLETSFLTEKRKRFIYDNQIDAIKKVVKHFKNKKNFIFFIRGHPSTTLDKIEIEKYKKLDSLNDNCFFIDPLSPVKSYYLIQKSDLIICFGSTIGLEAAYLKKNAINLGPSAYMHFKLDFRPKNHKENIKFINKISKKNSFDNKKYFRSLLAADAMMNQGIKFKYLKKKDFFHNEYIINNNKFNLNSYNFISILYNILHVFERSFELIKTLKNDDRLFLFKIKTYVARLKKLAN